MLVQRGDVTVFLSVDRRIMPQLEETAIEITRLILPKELNILRLIFPFPPSTRAQQCSRSSPGWLQRETLPLH
jgi:hypothetical protein